MNDAIAKARAEAEAAAAQLRFVPSLLDGPFTERRRALAMQRLVATAEAVMAALCQVALARPEPEPIPGVLEAHAARRRADRILGHSESLP